MTENAGSSTRAARSLLSSAWSFTLTTLKIIAVIVAVWLGATFFKAQPFQDQIIFLGAAIAGVLILISNTLSKILETLRSLR